MQIKAKTKTKSSRRKRRTPGEIVRMKNGVFLANENEYISSKGNLLGPNHLLQQTNKLNQLRKLKQLTLQEKHIVHEGIQI
jgi:hypothetical protein